MAEEKKKGFLRKAFIGAVKLATIGLVFAITGQIFWDSLFFPDIHDPTNVNMQATMALINDTFGFLPEWAGTRGDGGFMNTEFWQSLIEPFKAATSEQLVNQGAQNYLAERAVDGAAAVNPNSFGAVFGGP